MSIMSAEEESQPANAENIVDQKPELPLQENKSSMEILSELFGTFDAEPPVIVKKEKKDRDESRKHKKSKKKHKHKSKKHKKKHKSQKKSGSEFSSSNDDEAIDMSDILIKTEDFWSSSITDTFQNIIKNEGLLPIAECKTVMKQEPGAAENNNETEAAKVTDKPIKTEITTEESSKNTEEKQQSDEKAKKIQIQFLKQSKILKSVPNENFRKSKKKKHKHDKHEAEEAVKKPKKRSRSKSPDAARKKHCDHKDDKYKYREDFHSRHRDNKFREEEKRHKSRENDKDDFYRRYLSETRNKHRHKDSKSGESERHIDKKKLLEIARRNAIEIMKKGTLPNNVNLGSHAPEPVITAIRESGKSIAELTDFCKTLSQKENLGDLSSVSEAESESDNEKRIRHPFEIDENKPLKMNTSVVPLPKRPKDRLSELSIQFPVSSGQIHRKTENEVPETPEPLAILPSEAAPSSTPAPALPAPELNEPTPQIVALLQATKPAVEAIPQPCPAPQMENAPPQMKQQNEEELAASIAQRLAEMRRLQEQPYEVPAAVQTPVFPGAPPGVAAFPAIAAVPPSQPTFHQLQLPTQDKRRFGRFTGSTGANILSQAQLSSGCQAWARKDQLQNARPVSGGMGMHLLQKMGWKPGEGLGKEKTGALEPLLLEVKLDKKGIVAKADGKKPAVVKIPKAKIKVVHQKHPSSMLYEYAAKNKLEPPEYVLDFECGPDHMKNFLFKVRLNGMEYKPNVASGTKKEAKAMAATSCLQALGILPTLP